jgi:hypothetical protein
MIQPDIQPGMPGVQWWQQQAQSALDAADADPKVIKKVDDKIRDNPQQASRLGTKITQKLADENEELQPIANAAEQQLELNILAKTIKNMKKNPVFTDEVIRDELKNDYSEELLNKAFEIVNSKERSQQRRSQQRRSQQRDQNSNIKLT